jgi:hypothetical protein
LLLVLHGRLNAWLGPLLPDFIATDDRPSRVEGIWIIAGDPLADEARL